MTDGPTEWAEANIDIQDAEDILDFGFDDWGYHNFPFAWDAFSDSTKQDIYSLFGGLFEDALRDRYGDIGEVEEEEPGEDVEIFLELEGGTFEDEIFEADVDESVEFEREVQQGRKFERGVQRGLERGRRK